MKVMKTLLTLALSSLMLLGGNAMAQVASKAGDKAPAFTAAKQLTKATASAADMKAAREKQQFNAKKDAKTLTGQTVTFKTVYETRNAVKATKEGAKPTVTLMVEYDYYGDGSGQAIYLDKDATVFDAVNNDEVTSFDESNLRDWFEYSIPEGAFDDPLGPHGMIMADDEENEATIEVEAGVYDIWVANPDPGYNGIFSFGWLPSFELPEDAKLYITFDHRGISIDLFVPYDIAVLGIAEPGAFAVGLTNAEEIKVLVGNNGTEMIEGFKLHYKFDDGEWHTDESDAHILSTKTEVVALKTKADLSKAGIHTVSVIAELEGDISHGNDTLYAEINHVSPVTEYPYVDKFEDKDLFPLTWYTNDINENGATWMWTPVNDDETDGAAYIFYSAPSADYPEPLFCGIPFHFTPGNYHVTFNVKTSSSYTEKFDLMMGTSLNNMEVIAAFENVVDPDWTMEVKNLAIETEGDYYIGFQYHYTEALYLYIDDFTVGKGKFIGTPDLELGAMLSPVSSCNLGAEEDVVVNISNIGYGDVKGLKVSGKINEVAYEKELDVLIPARTNNQPVTILSKQDFSATDDYNISVKLVAVIDETEAKPEDSLSNNEGEFSFSHWTAAPLPFNSNFARATALNNWDPGNWVYDEENYVIYPKDTLPFTSRCMDLEKDYLYRFGMNYAAGTTFLGFMFVTEYEVLLGKSGTDWRTWEVIYSDDEAYEENFVDMDFTFEVKESGSYAVALRVISNSGFNVKEIKISEVKDYDVRINEVGPFATMMPVDQVNSEFSVNAVVENRGKKAVDGVKVTVNIDKTKVGEGTAANINVDDTKDVAVNMNISGLAVGEHATVEGKVEIDGKEDGNPDDNVTYYGIDVTKDVLAYDHVVEEMCTDPYKVVGNANGLVCLFPFYLTTKDTMTGISVLWGNADGEPQTHATTVVVYNLDMEEGDLGGLIYASEERKEAKVGEQTFETPAFLLEPGYYAVGVNVIGYELTVDGYADGTLYYISGGHLTSQSGLGNPGIRAKFGQNGNPMAKDVEVLAITKPGDTGYFTANETVVATVRNNGYEAVAAKFTLSVDGVVKAEEEGTLDAYKSYNVSFENIDLSVVGQHTLTVAAVAEGDENAENNEASKIIETKATPTADPYVMDFELCEDFAIDNFVPAWKTVDVDGSVTWDISLVDGSGTAEFPHHGEPMAYIAFNNSLFGIGAEPYEGERFGGSIAAKNGANDDWLISPALLLPETEASMSLMVKSITDNYGLESYEILVSESEELSSFEKIAEGKAPATEWTKLEIDLSAYAGKTVHVAIRCISNDVFMFMVDDIRVSKPVANENNLAANLKLYPNPAKQMITITGATIENVAIYNVSGRQVFASNNVKGDFRYNVSNLAKGMYFANVKTANGSVVMKFIVE